MESLQGAVAWITGAGSGIGRAAALALGGAGGAVVLSGRRPDSLDETAEAVRAAGGVAEALPLDVSDSDAVAAAAAGIADRRGRLDILVNNAGANVLERHFSVLAPDAWDRLVGVNLNGAFYCVHAVLPAMRRQGRGLIINIASWAGRHVSHVSGPAYTAAKHGMLALNGSINMEEGRHGIRACGICPGEVVTPILDHRPVPVGAADRARMLQPEDLGETLLFVARMPPHVCLNEILISPTWNRSYATLTHPPPTG